MTSGARLREWVPSDYTDFSHHSPCPCCNEFAYDAALGQPWPDPASSMVPPPPWCSGGIFSHSERCYATACWTSRVRSILDEDQWVAVLLFSFGFLHQRNSLSKLLMLGRLFGQFPLQSWKRKTLLRASVLLCGSTHRHISSGWGTFLLASDLACRMVWPSSPGHCSSLVWPSVWEVSPAHDSSSQFFADTQTQSRFHSLTLRNAALPSGSSLTLASWLSLPIFVEISLESSQRPSWKKMWWGLWTQAKTEKSRAGVAERA